VLHVVAGLDPATHPPREKLFARIDGCAGRSRRMTLSRRTMRSWHLAQTFFIMFVDAPFTTAPARPFTNAAEVIGA
jgi:hypothetical protein